MFNIGDYIRIKDSTLKGIIVRRNKENYTIRVNSKMIIINENLIEIEKSKFIPYKAKITYNLNKDLNFNNEIMLRHKTREEALYELDKFIDQAFVNQVYSIRIIHGKNGGVLREAVHEHLKTHKNIKSYRLGGYFEGQFGVTIAEIK